MYIRVTKGSSIVIDKGLDQLTAVLTFQGADLDTQAFLTTAAGKCTGDADLVYYHHLTAPGVEHHGDIQGGGVEKIDVTLSQVKLDRVAITASVHTPGMTFADVTASLAIVDRTNGKEVCRYDLDKFGAVRGCSVAAFVRQGAGWEFTAIGEARQDLAAMVVEHGLVVE